MLSPTVYTNSVQPIATPGDAYRALPRVSNSDLTRLKEEHLGYWSVPSARFIGEKTKVFGRAFHQHLLEPESIGTVIQQLLPDMVDSSDQPGLDGLSLAQAEQLAALMRTIKQDTFCHRYLRMSERERIVLSTDPVTSVACKARLDMIYTSPKRRNALVIDVKTTSARTQAQFLESCYTYDYDRQAAFYVDSLRNADNQEWASTRQFRFVFIGVMKQRPHRLFAVDATSIPGFIDYGRKKYRFWLRKWREEQESTVLSAPAWSMTA
ncbi:PD-(D/E)XK nuclease-like domain-containing protein [Spirosoma sp. BT702]|uniref:PD-(D/E)XK nuclease-like domain-containing protein n=1 Tax=Spirosoma profusum TaxID=2771354 RepID=A0A927AQE6_9BACT|nr:PD-(D/E)XK nuclease-like domain-containing protein [Spirosoma profusum]MBD2700226.1 PD-(D/E)XK nuclease-like domain-containing protein [Spirosoma profusum]